MDNSSPRVTTVLDLRTGNHAIYTLPPVNAVIAAYAQFEQRDHNTWTYRSKYRDLVTITGSMKVGHACVSCGNQSCLVPEGTVLEEWNEAVQC